MYSVNNEQQVEESYKFTIHIIDLVGRETIHDLIGKENSSLPVLRNTSTALMNDLAFINYFFFSKKKNVPGQKSSAFIKFLNSTFKKSSSFIFLFHCRMDKIEDSLKSMEVISSTDFNMPLTPEQLRDATKDFRQPAENFLRTSKVVKNLLDSFRNTPRTSTPKTSLNKSAMLEQIGISESIQQILCNTDQTINETLIRYSAGRYSEQCQAIHESVTDDDLGQNKDTCTELAAVYKRNREIEQNALTEVFAKNPNLINKLYEDLNIQEENEKEFIQITKNLKKDCADKTK